MENKLSYKALERRIKDLEQKISKQDSEAHFEQYISVARVFFAVLDTKGNIAYSFNNPPNSWLVEATHRIFANG